MDKKCIRIDNRIIIDKCNKNENNCNKKPVPGNYVPLINSNIDLASSTYVNNPIIPLIRPPDAALENKKYQVIIDFKKDRKGAVWPEWMKEPAQHALGIDGLINLSNDISSALCVIVEDVVNDKVVPLMVHSSDKINQISILTADNRTMEINGVTLSKISQDIDLVLSSGSINDNWNF